MSLKENMASDLLLRIINFDVSLDDCEYWLGHLKLSLQTICKKQKNEEECLTQGEFVAYFLNYLRSNPSLLPSGSNSACALKSGDVSSKNTTPLHKEKNIPSETVDHVAASGDFAPENEQYNENFPNLRDRGSKKGPKKNKKRINPTLLAAEDNKMDQFDTRNTFILISDKESDNHKKLLSKRFYSKIDNTKRPRVRLPLEPERTNLGPEDILKRKKIKILAGLYKMMINLYLVPNITSEINFILYLLALRIDTNMISCSMKENDVLVTAEDWKIFAIEAIRHEEYLFYNLGITNLHFLLDKIINYDTELSSLYKAICKERTRKHNPGTYVSREIISNKVFGAVNVSIENFENPKDFDIVCSLKSKLTAIENDWHTNHSDSILQQELDILINITQDNTCIYNFAKYFVSCLMRTVKEYDISSSDCNGKKMEQLNLRLIKPMIKDSDKEPFFTTPELFYKKILKHCLIRYPIFIYYLKQCILYKIDELTKDNFFYQEIGDSIPNDVRRTFIVVLNVINSLAKFLGFLEFSSFNNTELHGTEKWEQIKIRSTTLPLFDPKNYIIKGVKSGKLCLTIPWIVEFLCMGDKLVPYLHYYQETFQILLSMYVSSTTSNQLHVLELNKNYGSRDTFIRNITKKMNIALPKRSHENTDDILWSEGLCVQIRESTALFIRLCIGKLFDSRNYSENLFFTLLDEYKYKYECVKFKGSQCGWRMSLDCSDLVNVDVYVLCCTYFSKLKCFAPYSQLNVRNIRPIFLDPIGETDTKPQVNIQALLEEQFYRDYPGLDTLVDFVSGRVANVCQSHLKVLAEKETQDCLCIHKYATQDKDVNVSSIMNEAVSKVTRKIEKMIGEHHERITESLKYLGPTDVSSDVLDGCKKLCLKKFKKLMEEWLIEHRVTQEKLLEDILSRVAEEDAAYFTENRLFVSRPPETLPLLSPHFKELQVFLWELDSKKEPTHSPSNVLIVLNSLSNDIKQHLTEGKLNEDVYIISWDYVLEMITCKPKLFNDEFLHGMIQFWKNNRHGTSEERVLSPRTIRSATINKNERESASCLAKLLLALVENGLVTIGDVEHQAVTLLRHTWEKHELEFIKSSLDAICELLRVRDIQEETDSYKCCSILDSVIESINESMCTAKVPV